MKPGLRGEGRKRPVNLTLNENLVREARNLTGNLSGVVEELLAGYVDRELLQRQARRNLAEATAAMWNEFSEKHGSFADDYSTL